MRTDRSIIYHIYPLGFCAVEPRNSFTTNPVNRISKIENWLPHIKSMGCDTLLLGPVWEASAHGYDTADFFHLDRRLGSNEDFKSVAKAVHATGMNLVLDGVFNHVGRDFWAFRDVIEKRGDKIDIQSLENELGVKVVLISAANKDNIEAPIKSLMEAINKKSTPKNSVYLNGDIEKEIKDIEDALSVKDFKRFYAIKLLESDEKVALVVEDDLVWQEANVKKVLSVVEKFLYTEKPAIVLLSGDYWFIQKTKFESIVLATVCEAVCTQAYLINKNAAKKIVAMERKYLADDWYHIRKQGIDLYGVYPHIADQNRKDFQTIISTTYEGTIRKNLSLGNRVHSYYRAIVKRILANTGHKERKNFLE